MRYAILAVALTACGSGSPSKPAPAAPAKTAPAPKPKPLQRPGCDVSFEDCPELSPTPKDSTAVEATAEAAPPDEAQTRPAPDVSRIEPPEPPTTGQVTIQLTGFRNQTGKALVALFTSKKGYPEKGKLAFKRRAARISKHRARIVFKEIPAGEFAVVVLHDEDGDKKMNKNFLGMPQEGWGVSRNPKTKMRPPTWNESALRLAPGKRVRVDIKMKYL